MREVRCAACNKMFFKMDGKLNGHIEVKCDRCAVFNYVVDLPRANSLPLAETLAASSA